MFIFLNIFWQDKDNSDFIKESILQIHQIILIIQFFIFQIYLISHCILDSYLNTLYKYWILKFILEMNSSF
jgi:hypothetical protein